MTETPEKERLQSIVEHLGDLRGVLFRSLLAIVLGFFIAFSYADQIIAFLKAPILSALPEGKKELYYFGLTEQFYCYMKVSIVASLAGTLPFLLTQIWIFISPALKKNEKKLAVPFVFFALMAFVLGLFCAYRFAIPYVFKFLIGFNKTKDEIPLIQLGDYISLTLQMLLGTALVFEAPVVLGLLGKLGLINGAVLRHFRPQSYVVMAVLAAVLTPTPDAFSMILALIPLCLLYETSVIIVSLIAKEHSK